VFREFQGRNFSIDRVKNKAAVIVRRREHIEKQLQQQKNSETIHLFNDVLMQQNETNFIEATILLFSS
jgi:hypothetical protein